MKDKIRTQFLPWLHSSVVRASDRQSEDPGSIPGGAALCFFFLSSDPAVSSSHLSDRKKKGVWSEEIVFALFVSMTWLTQNDLLLPLSFHRSCQWHGRCQHCQLPLSPNLWKIHFRCLGATELEVLCLAISRNNVEISRYSRWWRWTFKDNMANRVQAGTKSAPQGKSHLYTIESAKKLSHHPTFLARAPPIAVQKV